MWKYTKDGKDLETSIHYGWPLETDGDHKMAWEGHQPLTLGKGWDAPLVGDIFLNIPSPQSLDDFAVDPIEGQAGDIIQPKDKAEDAPETSDGKVPTGCQAAESHIPMVKDLQEVEDDVYCLLNSLFDGSDALEVDAFNDTDVGEFLNDLIPSPSRERVNQQDAGDVIVPSSFPSTPGAHHGSADANQPIMPSPMSASYETSVGYSTSSSLLIGDAAFMDFDNQCFALASLAAMERFDESVMGMNESILILTIDPRPGQFTPEDYVGARVIAMEEEYPLVVGLSSSMENEIAPHVFSSHDGDRVTSSPSSSSSSWDVESSSSMAAVSSASFTAAVSAAAFPAATRDHAYTRKWNDGSGKSAKNDHGRGVGTSTRRRSTAKGENLSPSAAKDENSSMANNRNPSPLAAKSKHPPKAQQKKERNNAAARRSRAKRKMETERVFEENRELMERNIQLRTQIERLEMEIRLHNDLLAHLKKKGGGEKKSDRKAHRRVTKGLSYV